MNIAVIGTGVYALAMTRALSLNKKNKITLWSESTESLNRLEKNRKKLPELGDFSIDDKIKITTSYEEALKNADVVFIMCAARFVSDVSKNIMPYINKKMHFIIGSKGIEQESCKFVHEVFLSFINTKKVAVISGPSFAIDIANLEPIGLSCASRSRDTLKVLDKVYKGTNIKLRSTNDLIGIELCGSIKNVIAVAAGILEGLGYSESTRSFLITESLHDIKELISGLGGNKKTILSFAGVGDLLLTATSTKSRNYSFGVILGKGNKNDADKFLENNTVEGYYTLKSIYTLLRRKKIKMPVIDLIYNIVMKDSDPKSLATFLIEKK